MKPDPYTLAKAFAEELTRVLTPEQMDQVNERNAAEPNKNICHSHDFCDANQVMLDAFPEFDDTDEEHGWAFNQAWAIARGAEFDPYQIEIDRKQMDARE